MKQKLTISHLRQIIAEEVENVSNMDLLKARSDIFDTANKFLMAIESFKKGANPAMCSAIEKDLESLKTHLENMCSNPAAYAPKNSVGPIKKEKKSLSFKPNLED
jgi:hypothetical protein